MRAKKICKFGLCPIAGGKSNHGGVERVNRCDNLSMIPANLHRPAPIGRQRAEAARHENPGFGHASERAALPHLTSLSQFPKNLTVLFEDFISSGFGLLVGRKAQFFARTRGLRVELMNKLHYQSLLFWRQSLYSFDDFKSAHKKTLSANTCTINDRLQVYLALPGAPFPPVQTLLCSSVQTPCTSP